MGNVSDFFPFIDAIVVLRLVKVTVLTLIQWSVLGPGSLHVLARLCKYKFWGLSIENSGLRHIKQALFPGPSFHLVSAVLSTV